MATMLQTRTAATEMTATLRGMVLYGCCMLSQPLPQAPACALIKSVLSRAVQSSPAIPYEHFRSLSRLGIPTSHCAVHCDGSLTSLKNGPAWGFH